MNRRTARRSKPTLRVVGERHPTLAPGLAALLVALTIGGFSAFGTLLGVVPMAQAAPSPAAPKIGDQNEIVATFTVESVRLRDDAAGTLLDVLSDQPLVWTSYRDTSGKLVVELQNSQPGAEVTALYPASGLVEAVEVESDSTGSRPLTRLVIATRRSVEHSLEAEGTTLTLALDPIAATTALAVAQEPEPAAAPAEEEVATALAFEPITETSESLATAMAELGTVDAPRAGPPPTGSIASRLDAVEIVSANSETVIRIAGNGEFAYSTFRLGDPERFVIDLNGVVNKSQSSNVSVDSTSVDRIRVAQFKPYPEPVSRVVFDLNEASVPQIDRSAEALTIRISGDSVPSPQPAASPQPVSSMAARDVTPAMPAADPMPEPEMAKPEMADDMELDEAVTVAAEETYDSSPDFDEPVANDPMPEVIQEPEPHAPVEAPVVEGPAAGQSVVEQPMMEESYQPPVAPAYEPPPRRPTTEREAVATGNQLPATTDAAMFEANDVGGIDRDGNTVSFAPRSVGGIDERFTGEPIDLSLRDADVVETLRSFAKISGLNIVIQPDVTGRVTVELENVPWDQALEQVLKINSLGYEIEGSIMRIAGLNTLREEAQQRQRLAQAKALSVPLRTVLKRLSYTDGKKIERVLRTRGRSGRVSGLSQGVGILSQRGTVIVDERTNTLIIKELPDFMDTVLAIIETLDSPEPQVMIEARIVETTKRFTRELGVDWALSGVASAQTGNTTGLVFPNNVTGSGGVNLVGSTGNNGFLSLGLGNVLNTFRLDATLQAAESEGLVNILSAPKVATLNNTTAFIQSGLQIPIQTVSNNTLTVQFINATLRLEVTPRITAQGTVVMDIKIQKKEPQLAFAITGARNAPISTKEARTQVLVRDGGTAVIGGIYEVSTDQGIDRVPGLANIPIIGHIFKNRRRRDENDELLIFITPRVIKL